MPPKFSGGALIRQICPNLLGKKLGKQHFYNPLDQGWATILTRRSF